MPFTPFTEEELADIGITHPARLPCPQCDGELRGEDNGHVVMLVCHGTCQLCWHVPREILPRNPLPTEIVPHDVEDVRIAMHEALAKYERGSMRFIELRATFCKLLKLSPWNGT